MSKDDKDQDDAPEALEPEPLNPEEAEADQAPDKKKRLKKILMIVLPILIAIGAGIFFFVFVLGSDKHTTSENQTDLQKILADTNVYLDMEPMTVGLAGSSSRREHLRLDLTFRLNSESERVAVATKLPVIKDSLITFLRTLRSTDFNSSSSTIYLKQEITRRINKITSPITIKEVLFQEIMIN